MKKSVYAGVDIGGTKCAVSFGHPAKASEPVSIVSKVTVPTDAHDFSATLQVLTETVEAALQGHGEWDLRAIGISCGGPLDSRSGRILAPPNLPGWVDVDIITPLQASFGVPVALQNDADACALAEWRWGAGQGTEHMVFLTFGTGMGAGLILQGRLYTGAANLAGEVGHIRVSEEGPVGHGKAGSFEGFCSGGGIAAAGRAAAGAIIAEGRLSELPLFCPTPDALEEITAEKVAAARELGDPTASRILLQSARYLGRGIALLIDLLNPELVVIGSIYHRQQQVLEREMRLEVAREALSQAAAVCRIEPSALGERIGDYAALSVAESVLPTEEVTNEAGS